MFGAVSSAGLVTARPDHGTVGEVGEVEDTIGEYLTTYIFISNKKKVLLRSW